MASIDLTLTANADALQLLCDRMMPIMERMAEQIRSADPHGSLGKLELAFEDVFDCLTEAGFLVVAAVGEGTGGNLVDLSVSPSPVLERLCDLMTAICDGIDAKTKVEAEAVAP